MAQEAVVKLFPRPHGFGTELAHRLDRTLVRVFVDCLGARNLSVRVREVVFNLRPAKPNLVAPIHRAVEFILGIMLLVNMALK